MNSNRVKWGAGLIALVVLTFGLAGCGSEPAPVVRPPAPPPAPPPFQPQPVEVSLGEHGGTVTLMTAEGGGYTLNGEAFAGGEVEAENGNKYLLALEDDKWTAVFQAAEGIEVMLGDHGGTVMITKAEDGTYWIGEMGIESGGTVTAENGNMYTLTMTMDEEGNVMWSAMYVPMEGMVTVASLGLEIAATRAEDGTWTAVHPLTQETVTLTEGGTITAGDNTYMLSSDGMGMWTATFVMPDPVTVMLGDHGGTAMLQRAEDGSWWYGEDAFMTGDMLMGDNGQYYTLTMGDDGMWMAMWNKPDPVTVDLGLSGSVDLQLAEDNTWWIGEMEIATGGTYTASNGNVYMLTYDTEDGEWHADYQAATMMIAGTGLSAMALEDGSGYAVMGSDDTLPESGMGEITTDAGAMYRVRMEDGALMGDRIDAAIVEDTEYAIGAIADAMDGEVDDNENVVGLQLLADDTSTDVDESRTALQVSFSDSEDSDTIGDGLESHKFSDLLGTGSSENNGMNIVQGARTEIQKQRDRLAALVDVLTADADATTLESQITQTETAVEGQLQKIFGDSYELNIDDEADEALEDIDTILMALSSLDEFQAATAKDGDGFFEDLELSATNAQKAFDANSSASMIAFGHTADTRYGAGTRKARGTANVDLGTAAVGAFAYATIEETLRLGHVQSTGTATYMGGTRAVDTDSKLYEGDISIEVRFANKSVSGLITNLTNMADGSSWRFRYGDVESIILPTAAFTGRTAKWMVEDDPNSDTDAAANVTYVQEVGSPLPVAVPGSRFSGRLLGIGADAGSQAVGVWRLGMQLFGGFGAERGADRVDVVDDTDDGSGIKTTSILPNADATDFNITLKDGMLTLDVAVAEDAETTAIEERVAATSIKWTINLADEIDREGEERTINGEKWVTDAHTEITKIRDKIASLQRIGGAQISGTATGRTGAEDTQWNMMLAELNTKVFGQDDDATTTDVTESITLVTTAGADGNVIEDPYGEDGLGDGDRSGRDDAERLETIDKVLAALESESGLKKAIDDGIFDGINPRASAADLFGRRKAKLKIWVGSTDYTRFGAWREQTFASAEHGSTDPDTGAQNVFAYSPLDATNYTSIRDPGYPGHGGESTARYVGETVAVQNTAFYSGDIEATVAWSSTTVSATLTLVVSNLQNANGDPVQLDPDGATPRDIGDFIFSSAAANVESSDDKIMVDADASWTLAYEIDAPGRERVTGASGSDVEGVFVGYTRGGPQGVIGRWSVPVTTGADQVGNGAAINGAFGAEIAP